MKMAKATSFKVLKKVYTMKNIDQSESILVNVKFSCRIH